MTITTTAAANLATSYHDAIRMVSEQSAFHLPANTSPRAALERYLQACKMCGVKLHNENWEARAEQVVEELTAHRKAAWKEALRRHDSSQPVRFKMVKTVDGGTALTRA